MDKFFMIFVEGKRGSTYKHKTPQEVAIEAERLARLPDNLGRRVYVLNTISYCVSDVLPVYWVGS